MEEAKTVFDFYNGEDVERTYRLGTNLKGHFGKISMGSGYQFYVPDDIDPGCVLKLISERILPPK